MFINPISGTRNKKDVRRLIENKLEALNFSYQILPTEITGAYPFLKDKINAENITDVIICGGDGTVNQITAYLQNIKIQVGIIPMGSGNGLAFTAGIAKDPKKALDIILKGKASFIDAFRVNEYYSCHLCGLGFDAQVSHDFAKQPKRGPSTYIKQTIKNFFKAKPYHFEITSNRQTFSTKAFFVSIANSNQFGNRILIAPKASLSDGLLDIVIVNNAGKFGLIFKLIQQIISGKIGSVGNTDKTIHYFNTKKISIKNFDNAPFHIDGEPMETAPYFEIEIVENAFLLLQP
ncbi:MAG: YegS/Rv2252/BmrU family lipid kinase [Ferruginibacter sp.]|nr:YegS/Rv2252/BmrU family lipid kinase [Ferruginibacter sp.]